MRFHPKTIKYISRWTLAIFCMAVPLLAMNEPTIPTSSPAGEPGISEGQGTKVFIEGDVPLRYHLVGLSETELQATLDRMAARLATTRPAACSCIPVLW